MRFGQRLSVRAEGARGVDERAMLAHLLLDVLGPAQPPHRGRVQRRHQRQERVEVVELAQNFHYLQEHRGVLQPLVCVVALEIKVRGLVLIISWAKKVRLPDNLSDSKINY